VRIKEWNPPTPHCAMCIRNSYARLSILDLCDRSAKELQKIAIDPAAPDAVREAAITLLPPHHLRSLMETSSGCKNRQLPGFAILRLIEGMLEHADEATLVWGAGTNGVPVLRDLQTREARRRCASEG